MRALFLSLVSLLVLAAVLVMAQDEAGLPKYNIDRNGITVSGISSGAFMAVQFHLAHSNVINGVGVVAGGPYYCAQGQLITAQIACMYGTMPINVAALEAQARKWATAGDIDSLDHVVGSRAWIFSGQKDTVVVHKVVQGAEKFYEDLKANVTTVYNVPAQHGQITSDFGNRCDFLGAPYINNCDYDMSGEMLTFLYGSLNTSTGFIETNLVKFAQASYVKGSGYSGIGANGYYYVPTLCKDTTNVCKLHIAFHGCGMDISKIGIDYVLHGGYNAWAEANNIIVLYPQAVGNMLKNNPNGCWDWWGYAGSNYATKAGRQIDAISNMISAISGF